MGNPFAVLVAGVRRLLNQNQIPTLLRAGLCLSCFFATTACGPRYRLVAHNSYSAEARLCEMQAQRARDYCRQLAGAACASSDEWNPQDTRCNACMSDYADAFASCGGTIAKVCVANCDKAEERRMYEQTVGTEVPGRQQSNSEEGAPHPSSVVIDQRDSSAGPRTSATEQRLPSTVGGEAQAPESRLPVLNSQPSDTPSRTGISRLPLGAKAPSASSRCSESELRQMLEQGLPSAEIKSRCFGPEPVSRVQLSSTRPECSDPEVIRMLQMRPAFTVTLFDCFDIPLSDGQGGVGSPKSRCSAREVSQMIERRMSRSAIRSACFE